MARLYGLVSAVFAVLVSGLRCHAETLQLRFNWAPIFCYAGSNNGVPKEFCGQGPDGTYRFQRHRLSLLKPFDSAGCSNTSAYDPTALNAEVRQHLACTNPSYTPANADGWYARNWQTGLGCAAEKLGLDQAEAFEFMASLWDEYSPDAALARSRIRLWTNSKIRTKSYLKALKRAYGHDAFLTCDGATGKRLSTVSICIDSSSKAVTRCPKKVLKQYKKRCPSKLRIERGNGSVKSVTPQCAAYY